MKIQLEKSFSMPGSAAAAWTLLCDIESVARCMPGASITERIDEQHYKGTVSVKLGPANLSFRGEVEVRSLEPEARTLRLFAKGTDTTGSSAASMDLTARIDASDANSCQLVGKSEVSMSGKTATFGGRMMGPISDQLLNQFAANFATRVQAMQAPTPPPTPPGQPGSATPTQTTNQAPLQASGAAAPLRPPEAIPLNGLALAWAVIKAWLRSLFTAKRA